MSTCERCGATFHCAMADGQAGGTAGGGQAPCWCTLLPPAVPVPRQEAGGEAAGETGKEAGKKERPSTAAVGCWCPACLEAHIGALGR